MKSKQARWWHSSYTLREKVDFALYRVRSPKSQIPKSPFPFANETQWGTNKGNYTVAFTGDLLPTGSRQLTISDELKAITDTCQHTIINLEGIVSKQKRWLALNHNPKVLDVINQWCGERAIINVANNHAADFGETGWQQHLDHLSHYPFALIGLQHQPSSIIDGIHYHAATFLSNQPIEVVNTLTPQQTPTTQLHDTHYNLFIPHWGLEMHLYPERWQINYASQLLKQGWDGVVGNHSHSPQAWQMIEQQPIFYSLGNLCYSNVNPNHRLGRLLLMHFDRPDEGKPQLVGIELIPTCYEIHSNEVIVKPTTITQHKDLSVPISQYWNYLTTILE